MKNPIQVVISGVSGGLKRLDQGQQGHKATAFVYAVFKKYGDDSGGVLVVNLAYSAFMALFPLLLVLVTVLGLAIGDSPALMARVRGSLLVQFPIIGPQLLHNVHALRSHGVVGLAVGLVGLLYGSLQLGQSGIYAMEKIWNLPASRQPNWVVRMGRASAFLVVLGVGFVVSTAAAGIGTFGTSSLLFGLLGAVAALVVNFGQYVLAFRVLTPRSIELRRLLPGAALAAVAWSILQGLGSYLVGHVLRSASGLYGTFGLVLGLLYWLYLGARVTMLSAEVNTVLFHRLWPRGLVQPPLTPADQAALALQARWAQRRPEEVLELRFTSEPEMRARPPHGGRTDPHDIAVRGVEDCNPASEHARGDDHRPDGVGTAPEMDPAKAARADGATRRDAGAQR